MMFDTSEFSYKEIVDSLNMEDMIFENHAETFQSTSNEVYAANNNSGLYELSQSEVLLVLNNYQEISDTAEKCVASTPTEAVSYEPTLLDEQTVNQFLLPAIGSAEQSTENPPCPELLTLHTCVMCNDIFTSDTDLLDHTISRHVTESTAELDTLPEANAPLHEDRNNDFNSVSKNMNSIEFENDWLVCGICERVLSTALESEAIEQLCCMDAAGNCNVRKRGLLTMYVCDFCSGLFADGEALDRHKDLCQSITDTSETMENPVTNNDLSLASLYVPDVCFNCDECGKQYSNAEDLKSHTVTSHPYFPPPSGRRSYVRNTSSKMWNCGSCNQLFATARELYKHKRGEDRPEGAPLTAYVCDECDKVLGSMCALHTHRKMHKVSKPGYPCRICGRRFNQSGHLAIHMRMHTGERPYPCDLCPKAFKVKVERDDHRRTHTGERPFACAACPKTFTAAARLREHARIHTDQRPYKCEVCGAAFRRPYARTVHTLIHTGEKPHECDICKTAFRRSGDMWKHKRTIHGAELEYDGSRV